MTMHAIKAVDWNIFSSLTAEPVQYYSVLKQKREFSELVKEYDSQVFKYGYSHYCCIVPKSSPDQIEKTQLFISFMDELHDTSFIGFCINVNEGTFLFETNLVILFLKKTNRAAYYSIENNHIHVKCPRSIAWELFYGLYDVYLRRYLLTVVGTKFFYSFFYSYFIQKEKLLLKLLFKGSKVVNISKRSIFYKIHKKRKLSVTDILHTCQYMPQNKKYTFSCLRYTKPHVILNSKKYLKNTSQTYMTWFNKNVKHLGCCAQFKSMKDIECTSNSYNSSEYLVSTNTCDKDNDKFQISRKRKFYELEEYDHNIQPTFPLNDSNNHVLHGEKHFTGKWNTYCDIKPYDIKSYSEIPGLKKIVPLLLKNQPKFHISESFYKKSTSVFQSSASRKKNNVNETPLVLKHVYDAEKGKIKKYSTSANAEYTEMGNESSNVPDSSIVNPRPFSNISTIAEKNGIPENAPNFKSSRNNSVHIQNDGIFSTACGKTIFLCDASVLAAQKIMQDILSEKEDTDIPESKNSEYTFPLNDGRSINMFTTSGDKRNSGTFMPMNKPNSNVFAKFGKSAIYVDKNCDKHENFTTAAGKDIIVSNTAISAAQKMLEVMNDDCEQKYKDENMFNVYKNINNSEVAALKLSGCSSSNIDTNEDVDMDGTFVEKFFEDTHFEEQDFPTNDFSVMENTDNELKQSKKVSTNKSRKSLGGRRSIRYADKV